MKATPRRQERPPRDQQRFQDIVRRAAPLAYATRCRLVADEVRRQDEGRDARAGRRWLDEQLAQMASTPGTIVELLARSVLPNPPAQLSMPALRARILEQVHPAGGGAWAAGADSQSMWMLLMAPVPVDGDELEWLALSTSVGAAELRALTAVGAGAA